MSGYQGAHLYKHFNVSRYYALYFLIGHLQAYSKLRRTLALPFQTLRALHTEW